MKVITLTQPWATLVAIGAKRIETRSWYTNYRGPLAIHAAKNYPIMSRDLASRDPFYDILRASFSPLETTCEPPILPGLLLPRGVIIAICDLVHIRRISASPAYFPVSFTDHSKYIWRIILPPAEPELSFGDYTPGRYAWILENVKKLDHPIPAIGRQRLWNYEGEIS